MVAAEMLKTHPESVDSELVAECIDACFSCAQACLICADACLSEDDPAALRKCITLDENCADICTALGRLLTRHPDGSEGLIRLQLAAAAEAAERCAEECERHAEMHEHCRVCAEYCRRCQKACEALQDEL